LLALDTLNTLTAHDIAGKATWPEKYREHGGAAKTSLFYYADIEMSTGDVAAACFEFPNLADGQLASDGPVKDCAIDKVDEFEAEIVNAATSPAEKVLALKHLLHFVGDEHQPLHSARSKAAKRSGISSSLIAAALRAALIDGYISAELTATPSRNSTVA
jgi:hypothetical protein